MIILVHSENAVQQFSQEEYEERKHIIGELTEVAEGVFTSHWLPNPLPVEEARPSPRKSRKSTPVQEA